MKTYQIEYSVEIAGSVHIEANSSEDAKEIYREMGYQYLINESSYLNEDISILNEDE